MPTQLRFGEWLPDQPEIDNQGLTECLNVIPGPGFYKPFPGTAVFSSAMAEAGLGAWSGYVANRHSAFVGTASKIYKVVFPTPTDVSGAVYTTPPNTFWEFARFNETLIAANGSDPIQVIDLTDDGAIYEDLITSSDPPTARHITIAKSFLVLGNTIDSAGVQNTQRIWWSAIGDPDNFPTPGGVEANTVQSSYNSLNDPEGGAIQAIFGGDDLTIFLEKAIWKASYIGGNFVWQFFKVADKRGLFIEKCAQRIGTTIFFLDETGFYQYSDKGGIKPIGYGKVDDYFWSNVHTAYIYDTHCAIDHDNQLVVWAYVDANGGNTTPDIGLAYNINTGQWSRVQLSTSFLFYTGSTSYTLDELDTFGNADAIAQSFDSRFWSGGVGVLAGIDSSYRVVYYNSTPLDVTIETGEAQFADKNTLITGVRPVVNGSPTVTVQIGSRSLQTDSVTYGSAATVNPSTGWHNLRKEGRYHRIRVSTTGTFSKLIGLDIDLVESGIR